MDRPAGNAEIAEIFDRVAELLAGQHGSPSMVLFYDRDGEDGQCTVVTETSGPQAGHRVVRGREDECAGLSMEKGSAA